MAAFGSASTTVLYVGADGSVVERALPDLGEAGDTATVTVASEIRETLAAVAETGADCVVSEYGLPDGTATDLVTRLREEYPALPVLVLAEDAEDAAESVEAGATDSLTMGLATASEELLAGRIEGALRRDDAPDAAAVTGRQYRTLIEHAEDIVTVVAPDGTIQYQSPSVERILGWDPGELVGEYVFNYVHPDDREEMRGRFIDLTEQEGTVVEDVRFRFKRADGSWAWVESVGSNRKDTTVGGYVFNSREITERRERERELERYETVVETIPDEVYTLDDEGVITSVVPPAGRDLTVAGYEPDELVGEPVSTVMEEDDVGTAEALIRDLITEDGTRGSFEMDLVTESGDRIPFENHVAVLPSDDGFRGTVGVLRNIAERKERERRLRKAETTFENAQDGIVLVDVTDDGRFEIQRVNSAYESMSGLSASEMIGRTPREILDGEIGDRVEARFQKCVEQQTALGYDETFDIPGIPTHWHTRVAPVVVDDEVEQLVVATRDITERKEREQELKLRNRAIAEAPIGITIADRTRPDTPVVYANEGFERLTGYDEAEIEGRSLTHLVGAETDEAKRAELDAAIDGDEPATVELMLARKDGTPFWSQVSVAPVRDEDGDVTHTVAFQQDITEPKEYEQWIERRFDEFSEVLAEDLREPLQEAQAQLAAAQNADDEQALDAAADWLDRAENLLDDLTTVHSFSVKSRDISEAARRGSSTSE
ncbi:PAS domain S-box protein [Halorientalis regularis]|uniref:PAS domain S-box-containing protein n=1 Tax=Halorientalis regularis TaxID=660518 RepID=A0A1G7P911_9EURY|nr:PAS domain S-box protein [Halorientalis regularis]SDF81950.1 PAS domain S-box-containing protein [Halorientalis regularis]